MAARDQSYALEDAYITLNGKIVGGVQNVTVNWEQENAPKHEAGNKKPREIRAGLININGTVGRLFLDASQISNTVDLENGDNPYFTIIGKTKNKTPERTITIIDAMFKGFSLEMALNEDSLLNQEFDACDLTSK